MQTDRSAHAPSGPRPMLSIGIAHPDEQVQARLDALQLALGQLRATER